ncbi:MAG: protein-L-isoaspartate(D-aspartate) O-methyltransferase, partial [Planctomycetota bacterium]
MPDGRTGLTQDRARERERMVRRQISARGIRDPHVLAAMRSVPREIFLPDHLQEFAYEDTPLPIDEDQTISQPYIVALMTAALELSSDDRVLEIGTGSGYAAAVLARIARQGVTIERHDSLARSAQQRYETHGYDNIEVIEADGTLGWEPGAPYDAIVTTAGGPTVPSRLKDQLAI